MKVTTPANTADLLLLVRKENTYAGQPDSWLMFARPQIKEVSANAQGPVPYSPSDNRAAVEVIAAAASDAYNRTRAFWQVNAATPGQRAQLTVWADNAGAGVDIVGNVAISGNLLVDGTINGQKIGGGAVDTAKIATEAVTKSYFAALASPIVSAGVGAATTVLTLAVTGVEAGEVLRASGVMRLECPDDLQGEIYIAYNINGSGGTGLSLNKYKFDSDGGASTQLAIPLFERLIAPSSGTYNFFLYFINRKSGTDIGAGTAFDIMRQRR